MNLLEEEILNIIFELQPKIKKSLLQTDSRDREDLEQDIHLLIIEKLHELNLSKNIPSFWEIVEEELRNNKG